MHPRDLTRRQGHHPRTAERSLPRWFPVLLGVCLLVAGILVVLSMIDQGPDPEGQDQLAAAVEHEGQPAPENGSEPSDPGTDCAPRPREVEHEAGEDTIQLAWVTAFGPGGAVVPRLPDPP